jgi:hypothetical protein
MRSGRRSFSTVILLTLVAGMAVVASQQRPSRIPPPITGIPDASTPDGSTENAPTPRRDPRELLKENQKNLRRDADHLLHLAQELKEEVDKTEQTDVLSLSLVHKAEEVEKLAKQIKSLARAD